MIKIFVATLSMVFLLGFSTVGAVTFTIGDNDNFSNQSAAEAAATDGAQFTDLSANGSTLLFTIPVVFNFTPFSSITSAQFSVRSRGIQSNDSNPATFFGGEDGLTLDGTLVPEFFAGVEQGAFGIGTTSQALAPSFFASLADGAAVFTILMNSRAGTGSANGEPAAFDFFELTIEGTQVGVVPLPAALPLYATGLGFLGFLGWRRKRQGAKVA